MDNKVQEFHIGDKPGAGTYKCTLCNLEIVLSDGEELKACPICKHDTFIKV